MFCDLEYMQMAEVYKTPKTGTATPADRVYQFPLNPLIGSVDDWLDEKKKFLALRADTISIIETAWEHTTAPTRQCLFQQARDFDFPIL